jgi:hypothetical protein
MGYQWFPMVLEWDKQMAHNEILGDYGTIVGTYLGKL